MLKERASEIGQKYQAFVRKQRFYPQNVPLYLLLIAGWLWRQLETGGADAWESLWRDVRKKRKLFQKRPGFLLRHYLLVLAFYLIRIYLFVLLSLLAFLPIPVPDISAFSWDRFSSFVQKIPAPRELILRLRNALPLRAMLHKLRAFLSPRGLLKMLQAVPGDVQQMARGFLEFLRKRWTSFQRFLKRLRTPKRAAFHLLAVLRRAFRNWKRIRRELIGAIFSAVLLRLAILYLLPIVSVGIVSLIGANFLVIAAFAIQSGITKISSILARRVNHLIDRPARKQET